MAKSDKKRQQRLAKKRHKQKQKQKQKQKLHRRATGAGSAFDEKVIIRRARQYPIHECLINDKWDEEGMATVAVARRQSDTMMVFGVYLVDTYCLGVKNTFSRANMTHAAYVDDFRAGFIEEYGASKCSTELAHQVIYGALDYAKGIGFEPHKDFQLAGHILEPRDAIPPNDDLEFGKDGMPLYISGPDDSVSRILKTLEENLGRDGFHYIVGGPLGSARDYLESEEDYHDLF